MLPTTASSSSRRHSKKKTLTSKTARMPRGQRVSSHWKAPGAICNLHPWELLPGAGTKQAQGAETQAGGQKSRRVGLQARPCSSWALQGHRFVCHCLLPSLLCSPQGAERTAGMRLPVAGRHPDAFPWPQMFCSHGQGLDLLKQGLCAGTGCGASHSCLRIPGRNELCVPCSPWQVSGRGDALFHLHLAAL